MRDLATVLNKLGNCLSVTQSHCLTYRPTAHVSLESLEPCVDLLRTGRRTSLWLRLHDDLLAYWNGYQPRT